VKFVAQECLRLRGTRKIIMLLRHDYSRHSGSTSLPVGKQVCFYVFDSPEVKPLLFSDA